MKSTGIIYAVFKSAGKTRWKNLGTDDVRQARELLGEEIQREAKVDWKRARSINLLDLIQHYESNPMNLASSKLSPPEPEPDLISILRATDAHEAWGDLIEFGFKFTGR